MLSSYRIIFDDSTGLILLNSLQWDSIRTNVDDVARELGRPPDP